jgi:hypothetical protein
MRPLLQIENKAGTPVLAGRTRIIPFAQSVRLDFPGFPGGVVWNRPFSILVVSANGEEQVIRIVDVTRRIQIALLAAGFLGGLLLWMLGTNQRKETTDG